jgi:hypothetical protein
MPLQPGAQVTAISAQEFLRKYECPICLEPLSEAVKFVPCNHLFNHECAQLILNLPTANCPTCRGKVTDTIPDLQTREIVSIKLQTVVADPDENEAVQESPAVIDDIPVPEVYIKKKRSVARNAAIGTFVALTTLSEFGVITAACLSDNLELQKIAIISSMSLVIVVLFVFRYAKKC